MNTRALIGTTLVLAVLAAPARAVAASAYGWPVKPFDRQHPVRSFLDDPRIGRHSRAFHFGVDVAAPDGTPVYAVAGGIVFISEGSLAVVVGPHREFDYWHVSPVAGLRHRQAVARHQLLGTILPGWGHVHFAERVDERYVNPLRPGALSPYRDPVPPVVARIGVAEDANGLAVRATAYDTTWPRVPGAWANEPVTPALLRWRISPFRGRPGAWHTAVDSQGRMLDRTRFDAVFAPATRQNHKGRPGTYAYVLTRAWRPSDGAYEIEVAASDTRGNRTVECLDVGVIDGELLAIRAR